MSHSQSFRIVSLIPSATEIVALLGLGEALVGRSHECDYPETVQALPICTAPKFDPHGDSQQIHDRVTEVLQSSLSVYRVDLQQLQQLQPTHILTQAQCEVCAVNLAEVERAVAQLTGQQPQIISLQPRVLADLWTDIARVAAVFGVNATLPIAALQQRVQACQAIADTLPTAIQPTVACIEWIEPLMAAGNWIPELVGLAGGRSLLGQVGQHSPWIRWSELVQADPDMLIVMPCGFDLARTQHEAQRLLLYAEWPQLKAVQQGRVYLTDGNQYFNRPGPRLVDSLEILAELFHPNRFQFGHVGWQPWNGAEQLPT